MNRLLPWLCAVLFLLHPSAAGRSQGAETKPAAPHDAPAVGRLSIEGEAIERLVLEKRQRSGPWEGDNRITLDRPAASVEIPAGEYRVQQVHLRGGYRCDPPARVVDGITGQTRELGWFTVTPDKPYVLRVGAPLKPTLKVVREGRTLWMAYDLLDRSGREFWRYLPQDFGSRTVATLSVYSRDRLVGSGAVDPCG